jgi:hypothetical protein
MEVEVGQIKTFELTDNVNIGDRIRDQHGRIWEVLESVEKRPITLYKCKLLENS